MAQRIESPIATIPAGTAVAAPVAIPFTWVEGIVRVIEIDVPPGPSGLVGFYLTQSGTQLIPKTRGQFIITDDHFFSWPVEDFPNGSKWACVGYNTDKYDHSIQFHFHIDEFTVDTTAFPPMLALG